MKPSVPSWATEANYPAGPNPWNGQPTKVQPSGDLWTPNTKAAAEERNWLDNQLTTGLQQIVNWTAQDPAMNWAPEGLVAGTGPGASAWDPVNNVWLISSWSTSAWPTPSVAVWAGNSQDAFAQQTAVPWSASGAPGWSQLGLGGAPLFIGATAFRVSCLCPDPTNGWHMAVDDGAGDVGFLFVSSTSGTWTQTRNLGPSHSAPEMLMFNGKVIYAIAAPTSANAGISYTSNQGGSWTDVGYGTLTCNTRWLLKSNGSMVLAIPSVQNAGSYYTSTNGTAWTLQTSLSSAVGLHDQPVGLDWGADASGPCWFLAVNKALTSTPTTVAIYRSSDGITWTALGVIPNVTSGSFSVTDLAAIGNLLVLPRIDGINSVNQIAFSTDGGNTFQFAPVVLAPNASPDPTHGSALYTKPRVTQNGNQFMMWNSAVQRWSNRSGVPASQL